MRYLAIGIPAAVMAGALYFIATPILRMIGATLHALGQF